MNRVNNTDSNIGIYSSVIFFFLLIIIGLTICICWYTLKKKK